ncbi:MAG TPA: 30S ribosomal protein S17e [Candidatus Bathyarchaeia archaeon]|nr:MAG: 30S ribosomal protein S17e [Candidatus Bathyarchaeota archaeon RBG_16_48_13]HJX23773.1 30S ribosomal protein S17e [Candidatus Bathyarchaeia archaeon]
MGKVRTESVKNLAKDLMNKHHDKFTTDFDTNKRLVEELAIGSTKTIRNKVAGYISRLKRIEMKEEGAETPSA